MLKIIYTLFTTLCYQNILFAFNWEVCRHGIPGGVQFLGFSTSTSSFISSTGDCSMMNKPDNQKKLYIIKNIDNLRLDSARGQGDYISAYANLLGCSANTTIKFGKTLKENYVQIYGDKTENSPKYIYNQIEELITKDRELNSDCVKKN